MEFYKEYVRIGVASLCNHPLDFEGNLNRIMESIEICKKEHCNVRVGGELQISGYTCQDHFFEHDTIMHSWVVVQKILKSGVTDGILTDLGMPILHQGVVYNCRVILLNSKIVGIRPKMNLANGGNYFESRWFSAWRHYFTQQHDLIQPIRRITGQTSVPIGHIIISCNDTDIGYEICEQAWISNNTMIHQSLVGCQIFINPSGSHIQQGKLKRKLQLVQQLTERHGGAYIYSNIKGCQGTRLYFDGGCMFGLNGKIKALTPLFSLSDISVMRVEFPLNDIRNYRMLKKSNCDEASKKSEQIKRVKVNFNVATQYQLWDSVDAKNNVKNIIQDYERQEMTYEPSCWLWDYLKKSGASGFFLPLSGGIDSSAVALIVFNMCRLLVQQSKKQSVLKQLRKVLRDQNYTPTSPQQLCSRILFTAYLATQNSSEDTSDRASSLARQLNSTHRNINFQQIFKQFQGIGNQIIGQSLKFQADGGTYITDLALQNIQARSRMVISYLISQIELTAHKRQGFLLVLSSSNLDESLRGYMTKYDCSSGDLNPIGSLSKSTLKEYLKWNIITHGIQSIKNTIEAPATAELRPLTDGKITQTDQQDMGLTYQQLKMFGQIRKNLNCGPVSTFEKVCKIRKDLTVEQVAQKVKHFFKFYSINRHKMTVVTPGFHFQSSSCDDNRFDMRPFLYISDWKMQFDEIDLLVSKQPDKKTLVSQFIYQN